ncbi:helix-turn-helix transcriptional regulator [Pseudomonas fluorescens]|jgi:prophage regulatory protein|uniref:helix-turn-helix transcriptional regulator n=1 Tax=Pseudomonas fluorescens TaxID=294 RepID=UPI000ACC0AB1
MLSQSLIDKGLIPQPDTFKLMGVSRSGGEKLKQNDPDFPQPIKYGESRQAAVYYVVAEVEAYLAAKIAARDTRYKMSKESHPTQYKENAESHPCSPPEQPL